MRRILLPLLMVELLFASSGALFAQSGTCNGMSVGQGASLNGFVPFPSSSLWNTDVSTAPVDPNSDNIINFIGSTVTLHPDFGAGAKARSHGAREHHVAQSGILVDATDSFDGAGHILAADLQDLPTGAHAGLGRRRA